MRIAPVFAQASFSAWANSGVISASPPSPWITSTMTPANSSVSVELSAATSLNGATTTPGRRGTYGSWYFGEGVQDNEPNVRPWKAPEKHSSFSCPGPFVRSECSRAYFSPASLASVPLFPKKTEENFHGPCASMSRARASAGSVVNRLETWHSRRICFIAVFARSERP